MSNEQKNDVKPSSTDLRIARTKDNATGIDDIGLPADMVPDDAGGPEEIKPDPDKLKTAPRRAG